MSKIEEQLLAALLEVERAAAQPPSLGQPKPDWPALFETIDRLADQLPPGTDPALLHYLHKKSYQKARLYLEGRDAENAAGNCGHV